MIKGGLKNFRLLLSIALQALRLAFLLFAPTPRAFSCYTNFRNFLVLPIITQSIHLSKTETGLKRAS